MIKVDEEQYSQQDNSNDDSYSDNFNPLEQENISNRHEIKISTQMPVKIESNLDQDSQSKYRSYAVEVRVAYKALNRWKDQIVTLAVRKAVKKPNDDNSFDLIGSEVPLENCLKLAKNKISSPKSNRHKYQYDDYDGEDSHNNSRDNLNFSVTEEEYDRRIIEEYKSDNYPGKMRFKFNLFRFYLFAGILICEIFQVVNYVIKDTKFPLMKDYAYVFSLEMNIEKELLQLQYFTKKIEIVANQIEVVTPKQLEDLRNDIYNSTLEISKMLDTEKRFTNIVNKQNNDEIPLVSVKKRLQNGLTYSIDSKLLDLNYELINAASALSNSKLELLSADTESAGYFNSERRNFYIFDDNFYQSIDQSEWLSRKLIYTKFLDIKESGQKLSVILPATIIVSAFSYALVTSYIVIKLSSRMKDEQQILLMIEDEDIKQLIINAETFQKNYVSSFQFLQQINKVGKEAADKVEIVQDDDQKEQQSIDDVQIVEKKSELRIKKLDLFNQYEGGKKNDSEKTEKSDKNTNQKIEKKLLFKDSNQAPGKSEKAKKQAKVDAKKQEPEKSKKQKYEKTF